ncbi:MAG: alanine dehydrogenase [Gammaproteobacteria bacterium]|nr:alanine dehydrogenase [Gammaproteobacteria bacterium]
MRIGVPKEIKDQEYRVGVTPAGVSTLVQAGHEVLIQKDAGTRIGFSNDDYVEAGAAIVETAQAIYQCPMVMKVKEPQPVEYEMLGEGQLLFTYLHLAPDPVQTQALLDRKIIGIAYETVTDKLGRLPLLIPMSEVAGRLSIQAGATALQMSNGGNGTLLGGVPGVPAAKVAIIGGGIVGTHAARMAMGLGAEVTILDNNLDRLRALDEMFGPLLRTRYADRQAIAECVGAADLVIGAVLIPGKQAPKLVTAEMVKRMKPGSVIVDVAIDQGGCFETSRATTHTTPTYIVDDVVHYCVANMPGACARTSTLALANATLPYALALANKGEQALLDDPGLRNGLNVYRGQVTYEAVAQDLGYTYVPAASVLDDGVAAMKRAASYL